MNAFQQNKGVALFTAAALGFFGLVAIASNGAPEYKNQQIAKAKVKAQSNAYRAKLNAQPKADLKVAATPKPSISKKQAVIGCEMQLEAKLRDPSSVRYDRNLSQYAFKNNAHNVVLVYNAKNGFGGYTGKDIHVCTFKN